MEIHNRLLREQHMEKLMRNLVIQRITEFLLERPDLMVELDISVDELQELSNADLLEILEEILSGGIYE